MEVVLSADPGEFLQAIESLLDRSPFEHQMLASIAVTLEAQGQPDLEPARFAWARRRDGIVVGAVLRTPPRRLVVAQMDREVAQAILARWLEHERELPGLHGPEPAAARAAAAWSSLTGSVSELTRAETIYVLREVNAPLRKPPGGPRLARLDELALATDWVAAFTREVGLIGPDDHALQQATRARIEQQRLMVWDDGQPVSIAGASPTVRRIARIGPVYTPPEQRSRGYATALVAAVSQRLLDRDAEHCILYADAANPTSNSIYQQIGYREVATASEHTFNQP